MREIPRPPHQDNRVEAGLGDRGGYFPDSASAKAYASKAVQSDYGRDRVRAVKALVEGLSLGGAHVVDFGGVTARSLLNSE